jgi:biopolymer transport protein ExbB
MPASHHYTLLEYFWRGGVCMWPLLLCSVAGLAITLYKIWQFLRIPGDPERVIQQVEQCVRAGDNDAAATLCQDSRGPVGAVLAAGLSQAGQPREIVQEAVELAGLHELASLESWLPALQTAGYVAPLLGFLGTVTGMIKAFFAVSERGLGDPSVVSAGIAEALITTATGLFIAVPVYAAYNYFVSRVGSHALQMERASVHVINLVAAGGNGRPPSTEEAWAHQTPERVSTPVP